LVFHQIQRPYIECCGSQYGLRTCAVLRFETQGGKATDSSLQEFWKSLTYKREDDKDTLKQQCIQVTVHIKANIVYSMSSFWANWIHDGHSWTVRLVLARAHT